MKNSTCAKNDCKPHSFLLWTVHRTESFLVFYPWSQKHFGDIKWAHNVVMSSWNKCYCQWSTLWNHYKINVVFSHKTLNAHHVLLNHSWSGSLCHYAAHDILMQPWCACWCQCVAKAESETTGPVLKEEPTQFLLLLLSPWYNRIGWLGIKHQLTYLLLLGMNVVELMRKCVALRRLQQLPVTSSPLVHFKWGEKE